MKEANLSSIPETSLVTKNQTPETTDQVSHLERNLNITEHSPKEKN